MDLATLRTEAQRLAGRVDQDFNSRTRRFLNEAIERWAISVPWPTLVSEEEFTSPGTVQLVLPQRVKQVQWIADKTNNRPLDAANAFDREFPSPFLQSTVGAAFFWREVGVQAVTRQPTAIGALTYRTDVSDIFNTYAEGLAQSTPESGSADGLYVVRERVSISSSSVQAGTTLFREIHTLGKDDFTPADVVVRDSSSNVIARIPAFGYRSEYRRVEFLFVPLAGTVFRIRYLRAPPPLVDDWNLPHTAVDSEYLIWYAAGMIHEAQGQAQQAGIKIARAKEILEARIYKERSHGDRDYRALPEPSYWANEDQYLPGGGAGWGN